MTASLMKTLVNLPEFDQKIIIQAMPYIFLCFNFCISDVA